MGKAWDELASTARARASVYELLAAVFRAEPSVAMIRELQSPPISHVLADLGFPLGGAFAERPPDILAEELALEFTRLFIGPGPRISPYESLHLDMGSASENMLYGRQTVAVKRFIEATGLRYDDAFSGLPDHISAEFELMGKLAEREGRSWSSGDEEDASWFRDAQRRFLKEHIHAWVPRFCDKVVRMARQPFYRQIAEVTIAFLDFERAGLADPPSSVIATSPAPRRMASPA